MVSALVMPVVLGSGWSNVRAWEHPGSCCDCGAEAVETRPAMSQVASRPRRHLHPPGVGQWDLWGCPSSWFASCSPLLACDREFSYTCGGPQGP